MVSKARDDRSGIHLTMQCPFKKLARQKAGWNDEQSWWN
jgi:hypothetical protein